MQHEQNSDLQTSEWVSVYDRLPDSDQDVLMFFFSGNMAVGWCNNKYDFVEDWYVYSDDGFSGPCDSAPIYWMPLPSLPENYPTEGETL